MSRRRIFISIHLIIFLVTISCAQSSYISDGWDKLDEILVQIVVPSFPEKVHNITVYGAIGDGVTDCSDAFKKAIDECNKTSGGMVMVPEGTFLTGPIYLKSNVNLYISENATVKFTDDKSKYLPVVFTRWEGVECMNYSPLIYAYNEENIAVTGKGVLDGQGSDDNWWSWKGNKDSGWTEGKPNQKKDRDLLFKMAEDSIPPEKRVFGDGHFLRPNFFQPYKCKNVLIEGVTFKDSPMWFINPVLCENITVKNVTVEGLGPNNDGCNPESSKNVLIKNCYFNTGDDCIAIKSGRNNDGRRINIPSENIVIQNCTMKEGHGGVVIGSEISGGVNNVFAENCSMSSPNLDRAIRIKTNAVRGGVIENLFVRNITVGQVKEAVIKIDFYYEEGENGKFLPVVKNLDFSNITSEKSEFAIWIKAFENSPVENIRLDNCIFKNVEKDNLIENVKLIEMKSVVINDKPISIESD
jgi:polygalacturonase